MKIYACSFFSFLTLNGCHDSRAMNAFVCVFLLVYTPLSSCFRTKLSYFYFSKQKHNTQLNEAGEKRERAMNLTTHFNGIDRNYAFTSYF